MFTRLSPRMDCLQDLSRVEDLVRERFGIGDSEIVLVSEDSGTKPGFPPRETNVVFWKCERRYRLTIFAPVSIVGGADLPVGWLLPALEDYGEPDCC